MEELIKIITLMLISSVKFTLGIPFVSYSEQYTFTFLETNVYAITGGMLGVVVFMYFSEWLIAIGDRIRNAIHRRSIRKNQVFSKPSADVDTPLEIQYDYISSGVKPRRIFTSRNRRIVRLWNRYGLIGLAALTPIVLSIPLGTFFITRLEHSKRRILLYLFISIVCWSLILTSLFHFAKIKTIGDIIS